jgi:beta-N-acetylhexosaminidase
MAPSNQGLTVARRLMVWERQVLGLIEKLPVRAGLVVLALMLGAASMGARAQSLAEMAGQMVVIGFEGDRISGAGPKRLVGMLARGELGGVMYLRPNISSLKRVAAMNAAFLAARPDLVPLIAIDQEGGRVERLTRAVGFEEIPNAAWIAANKTPAEAEAIYHAMGERLGELGFNLNFGPVVDLARNPRNEVIVGAKRAYGRDAETVVAYARAFVRGQGAAGIGTALKHFPGHGSSLGDTHKGFVDISKTWDVVELAPYAALMASNDAGMVMAAHVYLDRLDDGTGGPASLSAPALEGLLRERMGFEGVIITDDLEMGAIANSYTMKERVIRAVRAGNDILLFSNTTEPSLELPGRVVGILLAEAKRDGAFAARIAQSYDRIVAFKAGLQALK